MPMLLESLLQMVWTALHGFFTVLQVIFPVLHALFVSLQTVLPVLRFEILAYLFGYCIDSIGMEILRGCSFVLECLGAGFGYA